VAEIKPEIKVKDVNTEKQNVALLILGLIIIFLLISKGWITIPKNMIYIGLAIAGALYLGKEQKQKLDRVRFDKLKEQARNEYFKENGGDPLDISLHNVAEKKIGIEPLAEYAIYFRDKHLLMVYDQNKNRILCEHMRIADYVREKNANTLLNNLTSESFRNLSQISVIKDQLNSLNLELE